MNTAQDRQAHPMPTAQERTPLDTRAGTPPPDWLPGAALARLGRQLLLVPEAVLLAALLCLHSVAGPSPLPALLGLAVTLYFGARMALLTMGRRALATASYDRADLLARAAALLHPASADAQALVGALLLARGEAAAAVTPLTRAAALFPLQADLHATLSAALVEAGRPHEGRASARAALTLNPRSPTAHLQLAAAEEQLGAPPEQVEAMLQAGLALCPRPAEEAALRCALAALLLPQGRATDAARALAGAEGLLASSPAAQRAGLHFYLGELLRLSDDADGARAHYNACEACDPQGPYAAAAWRAARL